MKKLLVTAFEPWGGMAVNPSETILAALPDELEGARLVKLTLPVVFASAGGIAADRIDREAPDAVLSLGLRGDSPLMHIERVGINVMDARMPDNAGEQPVDVPIAALGPAAYFATIPIRAMQSDLAAAGIPTAVSNSAGTYLCNCVMYSILRHISVKGLNIKAGFIHVPLQTDQIPQGSSMPSMAIGTMVQGITIALRAILLNLR